MNRGECTRAERSKIHLQDESGSTYVKILFIKELAQFRSSMCSLFQITAQFRLLVSF